MARCEIRKGNELQLFKKRNKKENGLVIKTVCGLSVVSAEWNLIFVRALSVNLRLKSSL